MQEKVRIFKSSWCYSRCLIHFSIRKKGPILCFKDSSSPVKASNLHPLNPDLLKLYRRPNSIKNMTNLRCSADHHAVPPLNIRPVESGIIPDHFNRLKNLSHSPRPLRADPTNPRCILDQFMLSPFKTRSLPIRQFCQSWRERGFIGSLVWTGLKRPGSRRKGNNNNNQRKWFITLNKQIKLTSLYWPWSCLVVMFIPLTTYVFWRSTCHHAVVWPWAVWLQLSPPAKSLFLLPSFAFSAPNLE